MNLLGLRVVRRRTPLSVAEVPSAFSYDLVGATRDGALPVGWRHVDRTWLLPPGSFPAARDWVLALDVLRGAGIRVVAPELAAGSPVLQAVPLGPVELVAPCRIAYLVDEPDRAGFAYGTVAGHPERGEEAFEVRRDGSLVTFTVRSFTRPGTAATRLGWPVAGLVVRAAVARYGAAVLASVGG